MKKFERQKPTPTTQEILPVVPTWYERESTVTMKERKALNEFMARALSSPDPSEHAEALINKLAEAVGDGEGQKGRAWHAKELLDYLRYISRDQKGMPLNTELGRTLYDGICYIDELVGSNDKVVLAKVA